ncbi:hypothetical protein LB467_18325 [Salegentibacter sp. JZCK2]|uniref:hypothetical protein n=1 Tax=Salegentibacter tibetensis TaxID=2873600 RepID=UPI001CCB3820|nr:hypothetical protein [Salegentibacter tibetensis]MBZ9731647.1 hypothetical protein [Salegentibacter tibetensis]
MKLFLKCQNCKNEIGFRSDSNTRIEFSMNEGERKKIVCKNCGTNNEKHVNEIYASESKLALLIAGLIFLIGTPVTLYVMFEIMKVTRNHYMIWIIGGILLVPVFAYITISKQEQNRVSGFNRFKINKK